MSSFWSALRRAPLEVQAFVWFCAAVVLAEWASLLFAPSLRRVVTPLVGANPSIVYSFALIIAGMLVLHRKHGFRRAIFIMLAIYMIYGLLNLALVLRYPGDLPQFQSSSWLPIWLLGVPLAWMAILSTPRVRRWCE